MYKMQLNNEEVYSKNSVLQNHFSSIFHMQ